MKSQKRDIYENIDSAVAYAIRSEGESYYFTDGTRLAYKYVEDEGLHKMLIARDGDFDEPDWRVCARVPLSVTNYFRNRGMIVTEPSRGVMDATERGAVYVVVSWRVARQARFW